MTLSGYVGFFKDQNRTKPPVACNVARCHLQNSYPPCNDSPCESCGPCAYCLKHPWSFPPVPHNPQIRSVGSERLDWLAPAPCHHRKLPTGPASSQRRLWNGALCFYDLSSVSYNLYHQKPTSVTGISFTTVRISFPGMPMQSIKTGMQATS